MFISLGSLLISCSALNLSQSSNITIGTLKSPTGRFLRGTGCTCIQPGPCGKVNLQFNYGSMEIWNFQKNDDGSYCIMSHKYPNNYLSLDVSDCSQFKSQGCGATYLNNGSCGLSQKFKIINLTKGIAVQSVANPNVYLRMDATGVDGFLPRGGGVVNGQFYDNINSIGDNDIINVIQGGNMEDAKQKLTSLEHIYNQLLESFNAKRQTSGSNGYKTLWDSTGRVNLYNYMYKDAIIYQDVFEAYNSDVFRKIGSAAGWDEKSYASNKWNGKLILNIGNGANSNGNGIEVTVPEGYDVLWLRVLNERWSTFRIAPVGFANDHFTYACGWRKLNEISPDGAAPDSQWNLHMWCPIPLRKSVTKYNVYSGKNSDSSWISGIAFGKNLWNHAKNSAVAYHWNLNGETTNIEWETHDWNNDHHARIMNGRTSVLRVPVVPNGKDKIVYIVEHNNNWTGTQHTEVRVNDKEVERFRTSYLNPFAVHHNSKYFSRYMATRVPKELIKADDRYIELAIDMSTSNHNIYFREAGTHDYI